MRKLIFFGLLVALLNEPVRGQESNVTLLGQWGKGPCEAVFRRGGFTFIGNGSYLELYRTRWGMYTKLDSLRMPGPVKDIWVQGDTTNVYVACGDEGLQVVYLDYANSDFVRIIADTLTGGYATSVVQYREYAYVADGDNGLVIVNVGLPSQPAITGRLALADYASDVWVLNDTTVLVSAEDMGIVSVDVRAKAAPAILDVLDFAAPFPWVEEPPKAHSVLIVDTVAYVGDGWGGMQTVDVRVPTDLRSLGRWVDTVPVDVQHVWVTENRAYLACGEKGVYGPVDVTNPTNPVISPYTKNTDGYASVVIVDRDTAYVGDGFWGHLLINYQEGQFYLETIDSVKTAGITNDVMISGAYVYLAAGESGIHVLDTGVPGSPNYFLQDKESYRTPGEARRVVKRGSWLYVADGSHGLTILDAMNPKNLQAHDEFVISSDVCYDVDVSPTYAFIGCDVSGLRVIDHTLWVFEVHPAGLQPHNEVTAVKFVEATNRLYIGSSSGIYEYSTTGLPDGMALISSLTFGNFDPRDIDVVGSTVLIANGVHGLLIWDPSIGSVNRIETGDVCTDVFVNETTVFITESLRGLRLLDFSKGFFNADYRVVGYYNTGGRPGGVVLHNNLIYIADGQDGLYVMESEIRPRIVLEPELLNFGPVPRGASRPLIVWVKNEGLSALNVTNIQLPVSVRNEFEFSSTSFSVIPDSSYKLEVICSPSTSFPIGYQGWTTASIYSNDPQNSPDTLNLTWAVGTPVQTLPYTVDDFTVGLWHFDEIGGLIAYDATSNNLDGGLLGNPTRETSKQDFNRAIGFDGIDDRIVVESNPQLNFQGNQFTLELWFKIEDKLTLPYILLQKGYGTLQYQMALVESDTASGLWGLVQDSNGRISYISTGSMDAFKIGQWYHGAFTWDGDMLRLYINGVLKAEGTFRGPLPINNNEEMMFGAYYSTIIRRPFSGTLDEVRISNVARQPWEFHVNRSRLSVEADTLNFGTVFVRYSRRVPFQITNNGTERLEVQSVSVSPDTLVQVTPTSAFSLDPGASRTLWLTYSPTSEASLVGTLTIQSSDPTFPLYYIQLRGEGTMQPKAGPYETDSFTLGLWHFDEYGSDPTVYDASGNEMHGSWTGINRPDGKFYPLYPNDRSLLFSVGANYICSIKPGDDHHIGPHKGGFSVEGWIRVESFPGVRSTMVRRGQGSLSQFVIHINSDATVSGSMYNTQMTAYSVSSRNKVVLNLLQWYHVAMSFSEGWLRLYINGDAVDSTAFGGTLAGSQIGTPVDTLSILIGRDRGRLEPFFGRIDEVRISDIGRQSWELNANQARLSISSDTLNFGRVLLGEERSLKLWIENTGFDELSVDSVLSSDPLRFHADADSFRVAPKQRRLLHVSFQPTDTLIQLDSLKLRTNDPFWTKRWIRLNGQGTAFRATGPYLTDIFTEGLYHFDETGVTSDTLYDDSGQNMNGSIMGGAVFAGSDSSRFGQSLLLDGFDDYVNIPNVMNPLDVSVVDFSIEFWFSMLTKPADRAVLLRRGSGETRQIEMALDAETGVEVSVWDSSGVQHTLAPDAMSAMNTDQWYHLMFSWDGDSIRLALNNIVVAGDTLSKPPRPAGQAPVIMGTGLEAGQLYRGYLDEMRISTVHRQPWEISVLPPDISVSLYELNFVQVLRDSSRTIPIVVANSGDQDLIVTEIDVIGDAFHIPPEDVAFTVPRMSTHNVPVTFIPTVLAFHQGTLIFNSNDTTQTPIIIPMEGTGVEWEGKRPYTADSHTSVLFHFAEGDTIIDASNNMLSGTLYGAQWTENGFFGGGLVFDGVDDYIEIGYHEGIAFDMTSESFTLECYFRTDTVSHALLFMGFDDIDRSVNYGVYINNEGQVAAVGFGTGGDRVNDGSWHHLSFLYDHSTAMGRLYIDGKIQWALPWTNTSWNAGGRPLILGAAEYGSGLVYRHFEGYLDEVRISDIVRETWEFQVPNYGIEADSLNPNPPVVGQPLTVHVHVPVDRQALGVRLYHRGAGGGDYQNAVGTPIDSATYRINLTGEDVLLRGFEYYVEVPTTADTILYPGLNPENRPMATGVRHQSINVPLTYFSYQTEGGQYQVASMFTIPSNLDSFMVADVFLDDFGVYDPYEWQVFWWHPDSSQLRWEAKQEETNPIIQSQMRVYYDYNEMRQKEIMMVPGNAYWIVGHFERQFDIDAGETVSTGTSQEIIIRPGWNMVGSPFHFSVRWDDCFLSSELVSPLACWSGDNDYILDCSLLDPWRGYWIHNPDSVIQRLYVPPRMAAIGKTTGTKSAIAHDLQDEEWLIKVSVETEGATDQYNYFGVRSEGQEGRDRFDRVEVPRAFGKYVSMYFDRTHWTLYPDRYAADIRQPGQTGHVWDFTVESSSSNKSVHLRWARYHRLPQDWQAFLFDLVDGVSYDMVKTTGAEYKTGDTYPDYRRFKTVVGTRAFIESQSEGIPLAPVAFGLLQNYPNPFNPETTIRYSIPKNGPVEIVVFNAIGQRVKVLVQEMQNTGHHHVVWDGRDDRGRLVSSGVYIYRLKALDKVATHKMILLR